MLPVYSGFFLRFSSQPIALAPTFTVDFQVFLPHLMSGDRKMEALGSLVNSCEQASSLFKHQRSPGSTKHLVLQRLFKHLVLQPFFGRPGSVTNMRKGFSGWDERKRSSRNSWHVLETLSVFLQTAETGSFTSHWISCFSSQAVGPDSTQSPAKVLLEAHLLDRCELCRSQGHIGAE